MSKVYVFEWCYCIHESGFEIVRIHSTLRGAFKDMAAEANKRAMEERDKQLRYGSYGRSFPVLWGELWRVRGIDVINDATAEAKG